MPRYSPEREAYNRRVHQGDRSPNPVFARDEILYRRYPEKDLVDGRPTPLGFQFPETSGISVNRGAYSEPHDVLEPDCCDGNVREFCVVIQFRVESVPEEIVSSTGSYRFRLKHLPEPSCFAHAEIWCNRAGDVEQPYMKPPKQARTLFYAKLIQQITSAPLRFEPVAESESFLS